LPGVILSLQQARYRVGLPLKAGYCLGLQPDIFQQLRCLNISLVFPPASLDSVLGELQQTPVQRFTNIVIVDQFLNLRRGKALAA
jgi:hypothetical protein